MPSMSYCMFNNTTLEMHQILNSIDESLEYGIPLKLSDFEKEAYDRLIDQCQRFLKLDKMNKVRLFMEHISIGDVVYHDMITSGGAVTEVKKTLVKVQCRHSGDEFWFKKDSLRLHK